MAENQQKTNRKTKKRNSKISLTGIRKILTIRVTDEEYSAIKNSAEKDGVSMSCWMLESVLGASDKVTKTDLENLQDQVNKLNRDLALTASNINQLAKWANTNKAFPKQAEKVVTQLEKLINENKLTLADFFLYLNEKTIQQ